MATEKIAIIGGAGELGFGLALRWAKAGADLIVGSRDANKAEDTARRVKTIVPAARIAGAENIAAAAQASIVVLAVPFSAQAEILKSIDRALKNKILVDCSVPLAVLGDGGVTRLLDIHAGSAAQQAQGLLPGVTVLSAFHNVTAEALRDLSDMPDCDILVCGDDVAAKERLSALVQMIPGCRPLDAGALEMSRSVEGITALLMSFNRRYRTHHSGIRITGLTD